MSRDDVARAPSAALSVETEDAPPLAPIDLAHLARMTLGDRELDMTVLALFDQQSGMLVARMTDASPKVIAALAHTLCGSAKAVGAWKVAQAAEAVELATAHVVELAPAIGRLVAAVSEARKAIGCLTGGTV
jgi:HPt (histidine-containing phosphotransfer) domain-containing protein